MFLCVLAGISGPPCTCSREPSSQTPSSTNSRASARRACSTARSRWHRRSPPPLRLHRHFDSDAAFVCPTQPASAIAGIVCLGPVQPSPSASNLVRCSIPGRKASRDHPSIGNAPKGHEAIDVIEVGSRNRARNGGSSLPMADLSPRSLWSAFQRPKTTDPAVSSLDGYSSSSPMATEDRWDIVLL
jgi:hypothetical protein